MIDFGDPQELIGAVLDQRWRLVRFLGQGGLAVVFEAEAQEGGPNRAVKILRAEFGEAEDIVQRFLSELTASARVNHPGIARVDQALKAADGTPYLVMELLEGQPLSSVMNRGRVAVEHAVAIALAILDALGAAHDAGVVHRDLKPGNVFVAGEAPPRVKILDFGIARVVDVAGGMQRRTRTGMLLGTPGYMSPEQIRSIKTTDPRADLWSVGIILYEMLTHRRAFEADNEFERITKVLNSEPTPIAAVAPQYAHWSPFFERALAPVVETRFQTAAEMADALSRVARGEPITRPSLPASLATRVGGSAPPPAYGSVPPPGGSVPATTHGSMPAAHPSVPPAAHTSIPPAASVPQFGTSDTAVSPGSQLVGAPGHGAPAVEVVSPGPRKIRVPLPLTVMIAAVALMIGFTLGIVVGRL